MDRIRDIILTCEVNTDSSCIKKLPKSSLEGSVLMKSNYQCLIIVAKNSSPYIRCNTCHSRNDL